MGQREHTVSKGYLLGFANGKKQLTAFDRVQQKAMPMSIGNASVVTDVYKVPPSIDDVEPSAVEDFLAKRESQAAPIFASIVKGRGSLDQPKRDVLTHFIVLQWMRTTRRREELRQMADWYAKVWFEGLDRQGVARRLTNAGSEVTEEAIDEVMYFVEHPEKFKISPSDYEFPPMFLKAYQQLLPYFSSGWNWVMIHSSREPFLTSDSPVALIGNTMNGGLGVETAREVWLIVGRHWAIVLTRDFSVPPVLLDLSPSHVRKINQRVLFESDRWVYWHPNDEPVKGLEAPTPKNPWPSPQ